MFVNWMPKWIRWFLDVLLRRPNALGSYQQNGIFLCLVFCLLKEKMLSAISVNKEWCNHQASTSQPFWHWALRELRTEIGCLPSSCQPLHSPPVPQQHILRRLKMRKHSIQAPDGQDVYQRNDFSKPGLSHFSIHSKALNSLTWDIWFSFINNLGLLVIKGFLGKIPWRRKWQPTPVFLPGESHGVRSLAGYSPQGRKGLPWWLRWLRITWDAGNLNVHQVQDLSRSLGQKISWRREWLLTSLFLPGEFCGQRSLVGYSPWGPTLLDMTEGQTH